MNNKSSTWWCTNDISRLNNSVYRNNGNLLPNIIMNTKSTKIINRGSLVRDFGTSKFATSLVRVTLGTDELSLFY